MACLPCTAQVPPPSPPIQIHPFLSLLTKLPQALCHHFRQDVITDQRFYGWVGVYFFPLITGSVPSCAKESDRK